MQNLNSKRIFNIVSLALIVGAALTCTLLFAMSAIINPQNSIEAEYFDGSKIKTNIFSPYDNACLKNHELYELINELEYKLFDNISRSNIIGGKNDFLFNTGTNQHGYNYLDDYKGNLILTDEELDYIYRYIQMRSHAYENFGMKYVLAVIPNTQTVYSELMPDYLGDISDNTLLSQVSDYLKKKEFDQFINLTDGMLEGKAHGQLYNNTENTINAMGAFVAYEGISNYVNDAFDMKISVLSSDYFRYDTRIADGKSLAKLAGLSPFIKNKTISISNSSNYIYTLVSLFGGLETTYTKYEYNDKISTDISVLLEFSNDWDKVQLMPYFSSTFPHSSYRVGHTYSRVSVANSASDLVIQVIREDEILSILDPLIVASYNDGLEPGQHPYQTAAPSNVEASLVSENTFCITGTVEKGSEIILFGDGVSPVSVKEFKGRFFAVVKVLYPEEATQICISVKAPNKAISDIYYVVLDDIIDNTLADGNVFVASDSMIYKEDYNVPDLPDYGVVESMVSNLCSYYDHVKSINMASNCDIIISIIPEKISVGGGKLNAELEAQKEALSVMRELFVRSFEGTGIKCIDNAAMLNKYTSSGNMFYQTSDRFTDLASYCMYGELMNIASKRYADAKPYSISSDIYKISDEKQAGGELLYELGFSPNSVTENVTKIEVDGNAVYLQPDAEDKIDFDKAFYTYYYSVVKSLPVAIVVRDGQTDKMLEMMAENFSAMYVLDRGVTEIPDELIKRVSPDVIIYLCSENNIFR